MPVVRELITKLSFRVDQAKLRAFDQKVGAIRRNVGGLTQNMRGLAQGMRSVGLSMTAFVSVPIAALGVIALKTTADLEKAKIALEVFLGSEEAALAKQKELIEFAKETPFQVLGIQETAGQLLAAGIESDKLITTMNALGNAAKGNQDIFQRLVLNFSQVKTQGKLTGRELRDFLVNQVPLVKLLSKQLGVSESAIKDMTSKGQIGFKDVEGAFFNASKEGGFFFDLMKKQSKTLSGRFSNLQDTMTQLFDEFGKAIDDTFNLRENIDRLIGFIDRLRNRFINLSPGAKKFIIIITTMIAAIGPLLLVFGTLAGAILTLTGLATALNIALLPVILIVGAIVIALVELGLVINLVVEDFKVWKAGGDSLIGSMIEKVKTLKEKWIEAGAEIGNWWGGIGDRIRPAFLDAQKFIIDSFSDTLSGLADMFKESAIGRLVLKGINILGGGEDRQQIDTGAAARSLPLTTGFSTVSNRPSLSQEISITVPPGTSEQQADFVKEAAEKSFDTLFTGMMTRNLMAVPQAEQ